MTGKFSFDEFSEASDRLSASVEGVNRRGVQNAEDLVDSVKDLVYRCLDSDVDSVYYLLCLLKNREVIACSRLLTDLVDTLRVSSFAHQKDGEVTQKDVESIVDFLDDMLVSGKGQREALQRQLDTHIENLARRGSSDSGAVLTGPSAASAKEKIKKVAEAALFSVPSIRSAAKDFRGALGSYQSADFESLSAYMQTKTAIRGLEDSLLTGESDPQRFLLESALAAALVKNASKGKRDVTEPKYQGDVTVLPGVQAQVLSGTLPFVINSPEYAGAGFNVGTPENPSNVALVGTYAEAPSASISHTYVSSESGFLVEGLNAADTATKIYSTILHDGTTASPDGTSLISPKVPIVPGTVKLILSIKDTDTDLITTVEVVDVSAGNVASDLAELGDLVDISDPDISYGTIYYQTGKIILDTTDVTSAPEYLDGSIYCAYSYYTLGTRVNWNVNNTEDLSTFFANSTYFDEFYLICGNYLYRASIEPPAVEDDEFPTMIVGPASLATLLTSASWVRYDENFDTQEVDRPVSFSAFGDTLVVTANPEFAGSANRMRINGDISVLPNSSFGGPTYSVQVSTLNQVLNGIVPSNVFGTDKPFSTLTHHDTDGASLLEVINERVGSGTTETRYFWHEGSVGLRDFPLQLEVGDDVYETGEGWHSKVTGFMTLEDGSQVATLMPQPPLFALLFGVDYGSEVSCSVRFTRNRIRISPTNTSPDAVVEVSDEGLGFSGSAAGISNQVSLNSALVTPGYNVKEGDYVFELIDGGSHREIGRVGFVEGTTITVVINEDTSYNYPFRGLRIESPGLRNHVLLSSDFAKYTEELDDFDVSDFRKVSVTFAASNAAHGEFIRKTLSLISSISSLRNTYLKYDSHVVNTVNMLLEYLKQEKLTVISDALLGAKFFELPDLTPQDVAGQGDVEAMLDQAAALYGSTTESVETRVGFNPLTDFINRGEDNNLTVTGPKLDFTRRGE